MRDLCVILERIAPGERIPTAPTRNRRGDRDRVRAGSSCGSAMRRGRQRPFGRVLPRGICTRRPQRRLGGRRLHGVLPHRDRHRVPRAESRPGTEAYPPQPPVVYDARAGAASACAPTPRPSRASDRAPRHVVAAPDVEPDRVVAERTDLVLERRQRGSAVAAAPLCLVDRDVVQPGAASRMPTKTVPTRRRRPRPPRSSSRASRDRPGARGEVRSTFASACSRDMPTWPTRPPAYSLRCAASQSAYSSAQGKRDHAARRQRVDNGCGRSTITRWPQSATRRSLR